MFRLENELRRERRGKRYVRIFKCGVEGCDNEVRPSHLSRGTGNCTSCLQKRRPFGIIFNKLRHNAKLKKVAMSISYENFIEFTRIPCCKYCGELVEWAEHFTKEPHSHSYNLDRKDPTLGYTVENCVVCCKVCNVAKNALFTYDEFLVIGRTIGEVLRSRQK